MKTIFYVFCISFLIIGCKDEAKILKEHNRLYKMRLQLLNISLATVHYIGESGASDNVTVPKIQKFKVYFFENKNFFVSGKIQNIKSFQDAFKYGDIIPLFKVGDEYSEERTLPLFISRPNDKLKGVFTVDINNKINFYKGDFKTVDQFLLQLSK